MKTLTVLNQTRATAVGTQIAVADTFFTRLVGLLRHTSLDAGCGLLIQPSSGVHTFGMRFPIDVIALDRQCRVRAVWHNLKPWRTSDISWKTHAILELRAGQIQDCALVVGDQLKIIEEDQ